MQLKNILIYLMLCILFIQQDLRADKGISCCDGKIDCSFDPAPTTQLAIKCYGTGLFGACQPGGGYDSGYGYWYWTDPYLLGACYEHFMKKYTCTNFTNYNDGYISCDEGNIMLTNPRCDGWCSEKQRVPPPTTKQRVLSPTKEQRAPLSTKEQRTPSSTKKQKPPSSTKEQKVHSPTGKSH